MAINAGDDSISWSEAQQDEIRRALERLLRSEAFVSSPRLTSFLSFLVEETLAGRAAQLKAYTIATGIFGLPPSFDPQSNSIVRVEAKRLRAAIERAYAEQTNASSVRIALLPGSYVPRFEFVGPEEIEAPEAKTVVTVSEPGPLVQRAARGRARLVFVALMLTTALAGAVAGGIYLGSGPVDPTAETAAATIYGLPSLRVEIASGSGAQSDATRLRIELETALVRFRTLTVRAGEASPSVPGPFDYTIAGHLEPDGALLLRLIRSASGKLLWSERFNRPERTAVADARLVDDIVSRLGRRYGIIQSDLRQQIMQGPTPVAGYGCILAADMYFARPHPQSLPVVEACLRREIAAHSSFADARSTYARLLLQQRVAGAASGETDLLEQAAQLAEEAVALEPHSGRSHLARFAVRFAEGRYEDAFESGNVAMRLNPNSTDVAANIGAALILRGDFEEGRALLDRSSRFAESLPGWYDIYYFIDAYMRGDFDEAARRARKRSLARYPIGLVAKMLMASHKADKAEYDRWSAQLGKTFPGFAENLEKSLKRYGVEPEIRRRIAGDLRFPS